MPTGAKGLKRPADMAGRRIRTHDVLSEIGRQPKAVSCIHIAWSTGTQCLNVC
jgi:hypothetical protein